MVQLNKSWQEIGSYTVDDLNFKGRFILYAIIEEDADVANNRTKVGYHWDFNLTYGWQTSYYAQDYVSGAGWNEETYREYTSSGTLRSGSEWVNHNDDGTGSGTGYGRTRMGGMGFDTDWVGGSYTLPTIPRASTASANPSTVTIGSSGATVTINTNRKSTSFTHSLTLTCGEWTATKTNVEDSTTFDIPYEVIAQFPSNARTAICTISCVTYNGSTIIGTKPSTFTLQTNTSVDHPNVGTISIQDTNSRTSAVTQSNNIMISNISRLQATIPLTVSGSYTQLASAVVTCGSMSQTYVLSGTSQTIVFTFNKVNAGSLNVVVTDERGVTATKTKSWTLIPYQSVTATATVGRESPTGSVGFGEINGLAYGGAFGATTNSLTINVDFKKHDDTDYRPEDTETYTLSLSQSGYNEYGPYSITFQYALDYQYQYDIRFTVSDLFSTDVYTCQLMQGLPIMSWDETEVDIWGDVHIHDRENPYKYQNIMDGFNAILAHNGIKNLLHRNIKSETNNGVTYTPQEDGSVKAVGTPSGFSSFTVGSFTAISGQTYRLTGCPEGGDSHSYYIGINGTGYVDTGDGIEFTATGDVDVYIGIMGDAVDLTFYPMIQDARISSNEFVIPPLEFIRYNQSGIWFRVQIGKVLILLCTNQTGGQLQFGVTFDSVPFVLTGASQGSYGHGTTNQQIWDLTTSSMRGDAYYGSSTKYPASLMVIGLYSGQI